MKKYICQNEYCKRVRYDKKMINSPECPYCGCEYVTVEEVYQNSKKKHKKK